MRYILIVLFFVTLYGCSEPPVQRTGLEGRSLPSFSLLLADSTTYFNSNSIPEGKPIVLFDFGPDCPYCRAQMAEIIDDMNVLKDIQFYVFTVWPFEEMKSFYQHFKLDRYPNITTGIDTANFFSNYFHSNGVPGLAIYDKDKRLKRVFTGRMTSRQIKTATKE